MWISAIIHQDTSSIPFARQKYLYYYTLIACQGNLAFLFLFCFNQTAVLDTSWSKLKPRQVSASVKYIAQATAIPGKSQCISGCTQTRILTCQQTESKAMTCFPHAVYVYCHFKCPFLVSTPHTCQEQAARLDSRHSCCIYCQSAKQPFCIRLAKVISCRRYRKICQLLLALALLCMISLHCSKDVSEPP